MKRMIYIFLAVVMMASLLPSMAHAATVPPARLIIDNYELRGLDSPPVIRNNVTMVPARAVFEHVGGVVSGAHNYTEITITFRGDVLVMTVGNNWARLNGGYVFMQEPPAIINNRTLIPLRFTAEAFNFEVDWDPYTRAAILFSPPYVETPQGPTPTPAPTPTPLPPPIDHITDPTPTPRPPGSNMAIDISVAPILHMSHPRADIVNLLTPQETGASAYSIVAASPITDVNHFLLADNRLVVDIYNSVSSLTGPFYASGPVSQVGASQFSWAPDVTRVVFHITGPAEYSISLSYDRRIVTVAFVSNTISMVMPTSTAHSDSLHIQGSFQPSVRMSSDGFPNYITFYIDNAQMAAVGQQMPVSAFVSHFVTGQLENGIAYVRAYVRGSWPAVSITHGIDSASIVLHGGLNGVSYDFISRELRLCRSAVAMDINQVHHLDEYLLNRHILTLPHGATGLGFGALYVGDGFINSINLQQDITGRTQIIFDTARVMVFTVYETATEYIIRGRLPHEVFPFIVIIDPGHGGAQPGTGHHGLVEKDLVLTISHMVMEYLNSNPNIRAYMTRHDDVSVLNSWRAEFANEKNADLFVSIHANAAYNRNVRGIETWYVNHPRETGWSFTSRLFATIMQRSMIRTTGAIDRGLMPSNPVSGIIVLRETYMPSVLVEVGFLTNQQEAGLLATVSYQRLIARAIYEGIIEAFDTLPRRTIK
ncbi:MAG: N-acetylmuramoyl-L-alanine amidase family protein [Defluviitaleaceae bacterium]|nr:N-acetylmuramoyl-L-alanine amidase family protein [Defluviitaleaceae bacterium]